MKLDVYLNYNGNCQEAFRFYEQHLGGKVILMMTHGQGPNAANLSADQKNTILHARVMIGNTVLMGADIPKSEPMRSAYVALTLDSEMEAERVYELLSKDGQIFMKMEKSFSLIDLQCFEINLARLGCSFTRYRWHLMRRNWM